MENQLETLFYQTGKNVLNDSSNSLTTGVRRFISAFGASPKICAIVWVKIKRDLSPDFHEIHLLWTLFFLKNYNTEGVNRSVFNCDEKTYRMRVWKVIESLALLKVVRSSLIDREIRVR